MQGSRMNSQEIEGERDALAEELERFVEELGYAR
jgi:hypothetical protein